MRRGAEVIHAPAVRIAPIDEDEILFGDTRAIIEARPPLIDRPAPLRGNYRLIAHTLYGDHARAPELARLNPRKANPNTIQAGEVLHAYAK